MSESRRKLVDLRAELNGLGDDASTEVEQAISRFLVVRACGHIEFTFEESFCAYAESRSSPGVASFVRSGFFRGSNPRPSRLTDTLGKLDPSISTAITTHLEADDQRLSRELSFMVDRRNKIAHGQSENVGRIRALQLADVALEVGDALVVTLDPR
ncbi:HEPN domain-containing protein [Agromyces atrinae]|uniref:HEPN domain-containing protein n=1 Tax=Agromyces atrinae TaxID=592376 RepID=UPI003556ECE7